MTKRTRIDWTASEVERLRSLYGTMPNKDLAVVMGKSKQAIQHMAHRIRITSPKKAIRKHCIDCGALLSRSACYAKRKVNRCVWCSGKMHSGNGHHNWRGGVAPLRSLVHALLLKVWIIPIMRRDDYTCQFCRKRGGDMNVHHILPYRRIRDEVIAANPRLSTRTFAGKKALAVKIVAAHKLDYGITLCLSCHGHVHNEKRGELRETLTASGEGNPQPSRSNVLSFVDRKVQRLMGEDAQSNKPDTSAPHPAIHGMMR